MKYFKIPRSSLHMDSLAVAEEIIDQVNGEITGEEAMESVAN